MNKNIKILLVEDSSTQIMELKALLEGEGYSTKTVSDGLEALNYLKITKDLPKIILSDIYMPNLNGFELCSQVRNKYPDIPIIILTAQNDEKNLKKAFESGAVDYLGKPFTKTELLIRMTNVLKRHDAEKSLEEKNRELYHIFNTAIDGMRVIDLNYNVLRINNAMSEMIGVEKDKAVGTKCYDSFPGNLCNTPECPVKKTINEGISFSIDTEKKIPGGQIRSCILNVTPLFGADGRVNCIFEDYKDITERNHAIKERDYIQNKLFQAEKMASIGEVTAGLGHEINQPLGSLILLSQLLVKAAQDKDFDRAEKFSLKIKDQVGRINKLIESLNIFSRTSTQDKFETVDLNVCLNSVITLLTPQIKQEDIKLRLELYDGPLAINASRVEIERLLLNLLNNARFAVNSKESGKIITVKSFIRSNIYTIIISDNGIGIPKDIINKIFDPFFTTKEIGMGTGLGLSLCHGIVKKYSGTISVESEVDLNTTFTLNFPVN